MSNIAFTVPKLQKVQAWFDWRSQYKGGFGWRANVPLGQYRQVALHHTDTKPSGNAKTDIDLIYKEHVINRGWGGIGYNIIITSEEVGDYCKAIYIGDLGSGRAHAPNEKGVDGIPKNQGNFFLIGLSIVCRNKDGYPATEKQLRTAFYILEELLLNDDRFTLLNNWDSNVNGHGHFDATWCPDGQGGAKLKSDILSVINSDMTNPSNYEVELADAKAWKEQVKTKYDIELMSVVDRTTPLTREDLLIILKRYTRYVQTSPALHPKAENGVSEERIAEIEKDVDANEKDLQDLEGRVDKFADEQSDALKDDEKALKDRKESLEELSKKNG